MPLDLGTVVMHSSSPAQPSSSPRRIVLVAGAATAVAASWWLLRRHWREGEEDNTDDLFETRGEMRLFKDGERGEIRGAETTRRQGVVAPSSDQPQRMEMGPEMLQELLRSVFDSNQGERATPNKKEAIERRRQAVDQARAIRQKIEPVEYEWSATDSDSDETDVSFSYHCARDIARESRNDVLMALQRHQVATQEEDREAMRETLVRLLDLIAQHFELLNEKDKLRERLNALHALGIRGQHRADINDDDEEDEEERVVELVEEGESSELMAAMGNITTAVKPRTMRTAAGPTRGQHGMGGGVLPPAGNYQEILSQFFSMAQGHDNQGQPSAASMTRAVQALMMGERGAQKEEEDEDAWLGGEGYGDDQRGLSGGRGMVGREWGNIEGHNDEEDAVDEDDFYGEGLSRDMLLRRMMQLDDDDDDDDPDRFLLGEEDDFEDVSDSDDEEALVMEHEIFRQLEKLAELYEVSAAEVTRLAEESDKAKQRAKEEKKAKKQMEQVSVKVVAAHVHGTGRGAKNRGPTKRSHNATADATHKTKAPPAALPRGGKQVTHGEEDEWEDLVEEDEDEEWEDMEEEEEEAENHSPLSKNSRPGGRMVEGALSGPRCITDTQCPTTRTEKKRQVVGGGGGSLLFFSSFCPMRSPLSLSFTHTHTDTHILAEQTNRADECAAGLEPIARNTGVSNRVIAYPDQTNVFNFGYPLVDQKRTLIRRATSRTQHKESVPRARLPAKTSQRRGNYYFTNEWTCLASLMTDAVPSLNFFPLLFSISILYIYMLFQYYTSLSLYIYITLPFLHVGMPTISLERTYLPVGNRRSADGGATSGAVLSAAPRPSATDRAGASAPNHRCSKGGHAAPDHSGAARGGYHRQPRGGGMTSANSSISEASWSLIDEGMVREALRDMGFDDRRILGECWSTSEEDAEEQSRMTEGSQELQHLRHLDAHQDPLPGGSAPTHTTTTTPFGAGRGGLSNYLLNGGSGLAHRMPSARTGSHPERSVEAEEKDRLAGEGIPPHEYSSTEDGAPRPVPRAVGFGPGEPQQVPMLPLHVSAAADARAYLTVTPPSHAATTEEEEEGGPEEIDIPFLPLDDAAGRRRREMLDGTGIVGPAGEEEEEEALTPGPWRDAPLPSPANGAQTSAHHDVPPQRRKADKQPSSRQTDAAQRGKMQRGGRQLPEQEELAAADEARYQNYMSRLSKVHDLLEGWEGEYEALARNMEGMAQGKGAAPHMPYEDPTLDMAPPPPRKAAGAAPPVAQQVRKENTGGGGMFGRQRPNNRDRGGAPQRVIPGVTFAGCCCTSRSPCCVNSPRYHPQAPTPYGCRSYSARVGCSTSREQEHWRESRRQHTSAAEGQVRAPRLGARADFQREAPRVDPAPSPRAAYVECGSSAKRRCSSSLPVRRQTDRVLLAQYYRRMWNKEEKRLIAGERAAVWSTRLSNPGQKVYYVLYHTFFH
eukprot:gene827-465_t